MMLTNTISHHSVFYYLQSLELCILIKISIIRTFEGESVSRNQKQKNIAKPHSPHLEKAQRHRCQKVVQERKTAGHVLRLTKPSVTSQRVDF